MKKGTKMGELIAEMFRALGAAGVEVTDTTRKDVELRLRQEFGGERVYVPSLPKQGRAVQLARLERHTQVEMATRTGLTVRQVRRHLRGK